MQDSNKTIVKSQYQWQLQPQIEPPAWLIDLAKGKYAAQLLWQRGLQTPEVVKAFIDTETYQPQSPFAFGQEMKWAVKRLYQARETGEKVTIWGDFDADGVTATSLLWEGLGAYFIQGETIDYYIPDRFQESHGLNNEGIKKLQETGTKLIVTCDNGSNNLAEIAYAKELGIDIIITDHHTLPEDRPEVIAIINPRYFVENHPLYYLSGVAVAYKLVEAVYSSFSQQSPPAELLDLVAIGLIADLVKLQGDCRYLAKLGLKQLRKQSDLKTATRPGVFHLLSLCKKNGDRPTDIGFGIGPRINAVSRIYGDSRFVVELLTSKDEQKCKKLAQEAEKANSRRKSLQKETTEQVRVKLAQLDLSTTSVIILEDPQWQPGVLGLVASTISREYGRPTILLSSDGEKARGSARSINDIDLYELVKSQAYLLDRFGGHPFAAGLSIPLENLNVFITGINQVARNKLINISPRPILPVDLVVTVKELGRDLFKELQILEPLGMGNPIPKLLIKNCVFENTWNANISDLNNNKLKYIKTTFQLRDKSVNQSFPGIWWEHYANELPLNTQCDVIVELDFNNCNFETQVRLIDWQTNNDNYTLENDDENMIIDWRSQNMPQKLDKSIVLVDECPSNWTQIIQPYHQARLGQQQLALAYHGPSTGSGGDIWQQLIGIAKYLQRTGKTVSYSQLINKLEISDRLLALGLDALQDMGFILDTSQAELVKVIDYKPPEEIDEKQINIFVNSVAEEKFQQQYFTKVPVTIVHHTLVKY